jgi:hypothetical protein
MVNLTGSRYGDEPSERRRRLRRRAASPGEGESASTCSTNVLSLIRVRHIKVLKYAPTTGFMVASGPKKPLARRKPRPGVMTKLIEGSGGVGRPPGGRWFDSLPPVSTLPGSESEPTATDRPVPALDGREARLGAFPSRLMEGPAPAVGPDSFAALRAERQGHPGGTVAAASASRLLRDPWTAT